MQPKGVREQEGSGRLHLAGVGDIWDSTGSRREKDKRGSLGLKKAR